MTSLLFTQPRFQRPEFRPDYQGRRRPWAELQGEVAREDQLLDDVAPLS